MWKWEAVSSFSFDQFIAAIVGGAGISPSAVAVVFALGCATILLTVHMAVVEE
jgi:hypothetical protein